MNYKKSIHPARACLYKIAVQITIWTHLLIILLYFVAVPVLFLKGFWSWVSAAYIIIVWAQYKFLGGCIITFAENYFLKKLGRKTHKHFVSRQLSKFLHGQFRGEENKEKINKISWNIKTFFFAVALLVVVVKLLFHLP